MTIPNTKKNNGQKEDASDEVSLRINREVWGKLYFRLRLPSYSDSRSWRTFLGSWLAWDSIDWLAESRIWSLVSFDISAAMSVSRMTDSPWVAVSAATLRVFMLRSTVFFWNAPIFARYFEISSIAWSINSLESFADCRSVRSRSLRPVSYTHLRAHET